MSIQWVGSPNYDSNRKPIDRVVIHWFGDLTTSSNVIKGVDAQFQKPNGTSAHYAVEKTTIHQYVKEEDVAYHAGNYRMNQRSIGIEHSAGPNRNAANSTYETSAALLRDICKKYKIPLDREHIIKHSEVKATQCCGTIDVDRLIELAKGGTDMNCDECTYEAVDPEDNDHKERGGEWFAREWVAEKEERLKLYAEVHTQRSRLKDLEDQGRKDAETINIQRDANEKLSEHNARLSEEASKHAGVVRDRDKTITSLRNDLTASQTAQGACAATLEQTKKRFVEQEELIARLKDGKRCTLGDFLRSLFRGR